MNANSQQPARTLSAHDFVLAESLEVKLEIEASAPGSSWATKDAEAPALRIDVDGEYNQHLYLWAGDSRFVYKLLLGQLSSGKHRLTIALDYSLSSPRAQQVKLLSVRTSPITKNSHHSNDDLLAIVHSPLLSQRANTIGKFTDLPILMYYEIWHRNNNEVQIRYTTIFTNEDGGTPSAALMARWGRASDIEWTYEVTMRSGQIVEESFQGVSHETKPFGGARMKGSHPLLAVASDNNNFSDQPRSSIHFAFFPIAADLRESTRETVMDLNPSSYKVVTEELMREGKLKAEPSDPNTIADPRNYVYVDLSAIQDHSSLSVEVKSTRQLSSSSSDLGDAKLRIERSGNFRTAIRLASAQSAAAVSAVIVHCYSTGGHDCKNVEVKKVSYLTQDYHPHFLRIQRAPKHTLGPNDSLTVRVVR